MRAGAHFVRNPLGFDLTVHNDTVANSVTVILRRNVPHAFDIETPAARCGASRAEDPMNYLPGTKRPGVIVLIVGARRVVLSADRTVDLRHGESPTTDHHHHYRRYPRSPQNSDNSHLLHPLQLLHGGNPALAASR
jgi:hypothetical protein